MSNSTITIIGSALLALVLAGYVAQKYLPAPVPRIAGIDLGTTFSSIGVYHAVTGDTEIIPDGKNRKTIPSVVAFLPNGTILIGHDAVAQSEHNPVGTIYDAKRFIGKTFQRDSEDFQREIRRYPFKIDLDENGLAYFLVPQEFEGKPEFRKVTPEEVGGFIIAHLRQMGQRWSRDKMTLAKAVISVPTEFGEQQRNATSRAATHGGLEILRVITEPTAAALAYGLHKKQGVENVIIVDLGGGTLDVAVLWLQGGMFVTRSLAGNNRLGGQDFNERVLKRLLMVIHDHYGSAKSASAAEDAEDVQNLRLAVEAAKLRLTFHPTAKIDLHLNSVGHFKYVMKRDEFEELNADLFRRVLDPIAAALEDAELEVDDIDEIVLVGGSTRIPRVRRVVGEYFNKVPNYGVDPELAVVTGVAVQAGVLAGGWPLQVSAVELPAQRRKRHVYHETRTREEV